MISETPGPVCVAFSLFIGLLGVRRNGSLILVPSFGLVSFCWVALSNFNMVVFVLPYHTFVNVLLLSLRSLFFSNERQKEWIWMDGRGGGEKMGKLHDI